MREARSSRDGVDGRVGSGGRSWPKLTQVSCGIGWLHTGPTCSTRKCCSMLCNASAWKWVQSSRIVHGYTVHAGTTTRVVARNEEKCLQ